MIPVEPYAKFSYWHIKLSNVVIFTWYIEYPCKILDSLFSFLTEMFYFIILQLFC